MTQKPSVKTLKVIIRKKIPSFVPFLESEKAVAEKTKASVLKYNPNVEVKMVEGKTPEDVPQTKRVSWVLFNLVIPAYRKRGYNKGFYWIENSVKIKKSFEDWIKEHAPTRPHNRPYWMGFTKLLSDYRVGSKVVFFPPAVVDNIEKRFKEGKIKLAHTDRTLQALNPIVGKTKKVGISTLPGDDLFALFPKRSTTRTKHHPSLYEQ